MGGEKREKISSFLFGIDSLVVVVVSCPKKNSCSANQNENDANKNRKKASDH